MSHGKELQLTDLIRYFSRPEGDYNPRVGVEVEKIGLYSDSVKAPTYGGRRGYLAILGKLYEELGWEIVKQQGKSITSMKRGNSFLHLESDGRIELAGGPHNSIHDLAREMRLHQNEINEISKIFGITWIGLGYHPFVKSAELNDLLDARKRIILDYFLNLRDLGNDFGLACVKKTSGVHVNIDFEDEEDFALKSRVMLRISPILAAMFANSPFSKKKFTGYLSFRSHVNHNTGLAQYDIPRELYESDFDYRSWLSHVTSLPLLMINRGDEWIQPKVSFQEFMDHGFEGHHATMEDFHMHMKTVWKEIKAKNVIELRFFDSVPPSLIPSIAAVVKAIAYDKEALLELEKMTQNWSYTDFMNMRADAEKHALQAKMGETKLLDYAKEILSMSKHSLRQYRILDAEMSDESLYLRPIEELILIKEKSPARWLVESWLGPWQKSFYPVVEWLKY